MSEPDPDLTRIVDAVARRWFDRQQSRRLDPGRLDASGKPWTFEALTPGDQLAARSYVLPFVTDTLAALEEE